MIHQRAAGINFSEASEVGEGGNKLREGWLKMTVVEPPSVEFVEDPQLPYVTCERSAVVTLSKGGFMS
jgi:hypothetical protein